MQPRIISAAFFGFALPSLLLGGDFVPIRGGVLPGAPHVRVDDFEMLDHPVTNSEYSQFVAATGHPAPPHWQGGRIPAGMENRPVVFVNRFDADAYMKWRSRAEGREYRFPMLSEFVYAARAGSADAIYPWGKAPATGRANFDADGTRSLGDWQRYLQPVKSFPANQWGLYDLAGNVFQMVSTQPDYSQEKYIYRLESPLSLDDTAVGGSWSRTERYLRCDATLRVRSGKRLPDVGFRPVRAPLGSTHFQTQLRRVLAAPAAAGAVYVGWQLLPQDDSNTGFHVYRSTRRDAAGQRITVEPVRTSTNFLDTQPPGDKRVYYRVRAVGTDGKEGPPSEWAGVTPGAAPTKLIAVFETTMKQGQIDPAFGDLDGDGVMDAVLRLDNGISEMSRDPGVPVELEAFTSYGRPLWRRPLANHDLLYGNAYNAAFIVYDLDNDGKAEVICRLQEGDSLYLSVLDGLTGRVLRKTPWREMETDRTISSSRVHLAIAYLDGRSPSVITQTGLYENEIFDAYDASLKRLWTFNSVLATNGSGSHHIEVADVDGDGKDEVFDGTTLLNPDGTMRWSIYREHADIVQIARILPDTRERQVFFGVESTRPGAYLVDARSGKMIWKIDEDDDPRWQHSDIGWAADIWDGSPGLEMLTNRDGHLAKDTVLFSSTGKILANPLPGGRWWPVNWTGAPTRELLSSDGAQLVRFDGRGLAPLPGAGPHSGGGHRVMVADLAGDFRDEVICSGTGSQGGQAIFVYSNIEPVQRRELARTASREYRVWLARNVGGGYGSYYEWQPE